MNTKLQWSNERLNSATNFTKPKKNNKYFWGFQFSKQKQKEIATKAKYFWVFSSSKPKIASKANQR
jgi:CRISPR/Cas system endoribonuclease Cas6 (RAMP superfamily)